MTRGEKKEEEKSRVTRAQKRGEKDNGKQFSEIKAVWTIVY